MCSLVKRREGSFNDNKNQAITRFFAPADEQISWPAAGHCQRVLNKAQLRKC